MVFINTVSTLWANTVKLHVDNKKKDGGNSPFPWQSHILCFNRLFAAVKSVFHFMACQQCPCLNLSYSPFIPCNPSIHPSLCALLTKHLCSVFFFFFSIPPRSYEHLSAESFSPLLSVIHPVTFSFPFGYRTGILFFQKRCVVNTAPVLPSRPSQL